MLRMGDAQDAKNSNSRGKRTHSEHTKNHNQLKTMQHIDRQVGRRECTYQKGKPVEVGRGRRLSECGMAAGFAIYDVSKKSHNFAGNAH